MSKPARRTITNANPLTVEEINAFRDHVEIGETVPTIVGLKHWTSSTNFVWVPKMATVTILRKYPNLVDTDWGIMSWKDMVAGYHGVNPFAKEPAEKSASVVWNVAA